MPGPAPFTAEQLLERRNSIGASEAHDVVCGRWHKLWLRKTGRDVPEPENDDMVFGRMMEGAVLTRYAQLTGLRLERPTWSSVRPQHPRVTATPDAVAYRDDATTDRVVEVKCPRYTTGWGDEASRVVPARVWWQIQQQMYCTGARCADVAMLAHRAVRIYRDIPRNDEAIRLLVAEIEWGWQKYIAADVEPPPDDSAECAQHLARLYPTAPTDRQVMSCDDLEVAAAARAYQAAKRTCDDAEAAKRQAKSTLISRIGNSYGLEGAWGTATAGNVAGRKRVDYAALCLDLIRVGGENADAAAAKLAELEQKHTTVGGGYRRLDVTLRDSE